MQHYKGYVLQHSAPTAAQCIADESAQVKGREREVLMAQSALASHKLQLRQKEQQAAL